MELQPVNFVPKNGLQKIKNADRKKYVFFNFSHKNPIVGPSKRRSQN
jgi:hypothetical protein